MAYDPTTFDVSLVMNNHRGRPYLARTMRSFAQAAYFARAAGLSVEAVFVLDRPDVATTEWVESYEPAAFAQTRIEKVDYGSLGLSRDHGMRLACGDYIMFGDDDDLISFNSITESHRLAKEEGPRCIVIPEYQFGFGLKNFITRYFGTEHVSPHSFIAYHPFGSRLFAHNSIRNHMEFHDVPVSAGYAYEDWHFNASAYSLGYIYRPAPNTILFYRHRTGLLDSMNVVSTRQIPPTRLFRPDIYRHICANCEFLADHFPPEESAPEAIRTSFFENPLLRELVLAAHLLDPAIDVEKPRTALGISNTVGNLGRGAAYLRACEIVGDARFTDVVLWSSTLRDIDVHSIISKLDTLRPSEPELRVLVLSPSTATRVDLLAERFPSLKVVDLAALHSWLDAADIDTIALRLIESTAYASRLHLLPGEFSYRFFARFRVLLKAHRKYYYRFEDIDRSVADPRSHATDVFQFISDFLEDIDEILATKDADIKFDQIRFDRSLEKWKLLDRFRLAEASQSPLS